VDELENLMKGLYHGPPPAKEVSKLFAKFDANKDGRISWVEFDTAVQALRGVCVCARACVRAGMHGCACVVAGGWVVGAVLENSVFPRPISSHSLFLSIFGIIVLLLL
jgi:hypothetical protein